MKRLFDDNDRFTLDGQKLAEEVGGFITAKVSNWVKAGFSARDIQLIIQGAVLDACIMEILDSKNYR